MEKELYSMIFKRKSFHIFRDIGSIIPAELQNIEEKYDTFSPMIDGIQTTTRIVPAAKTTCKRGQEYCILLYSEKKDNYLQNIGHLGEQLDLYLKSKRYLENTASFGRANAFLYRNRIIFSFLISSARLSDE